MTETILVAGAGIAGLSAAMALASPSRSVTVIDRDPPPPDATPDQAFYEWERKGVTQLRHSHVFLGRLVKLIRERHPALWTQLLEGGARESPYADSLPPALKAAYKPQPGDEDLSFLFSRRSTLELVMRRYAASLPNVAFITNAGLRGIVTEKRGDTLAVTALKVTVDGEERILEADAFVDATGRVSQFSDWLAEAGTAIEVAPNPAGILYFTRHYKLRDGQDEPSREGPPGAGDMGYLKYGVFINDNRHFSITLAVPEIETALRTAVFKPETFDAVCMMIPGAARWIDPQRAEPVSKVFGMGDLQSSWRRYVVDGKPAVLNLYPIGDAIVRTNPLYGRGCSMGAIQAHMLAEIFDRQNDAATRLIELDARVRGELTPFFDIMAKQDAQAIKRAQNERDPTYKPSFKARTTKSFVEDAVGPATRSDITVSRAVMRAFHMIDHPTAWTKNPAIMARVLKTWATPKFMKRGHYPPKLGPKRAEMLSQLGLSA